MRDDGLEALTKGVRYSNAMDSGCGMFRECLRYKLAQQGKVLIEVDRYTPTTRTCSACGLVRDSEVDYRERSWTRSPGDRLGAERRPAS